MCNVLVHLHCIYTGTIDYYLYVHGDVHLQCTCTGVHVYYRKLYTVEPLNNKHIGTSTLVHLVEVSAIWRAVIY